MSKEKIEVGDWVRLTGKTWAEDYPDAPSYVQVSMIRPFGQIDTEEVGDVGNSFGLYGPDNEVMGCDYACEWVPASEVPAEIRSKGHPSLRFSNAAGYRGTDGPGVEVVDISPDQGSVAFKGLDPISPDHYEYPGGVQVIDITRHMDFLTGNVVKYVTRAGRKGNRLEDLKKAQVYLRWAIEDEENA